jgi:hypothetical protein
MAERGFQNISCGRGCLGVTKGERDPWTRTIRSSEQRIASACGPTRCLLLEDKAPDTHPHAPLKASDLGEDGRQADTAHRVPKARDKPLLGMWTSFHVDKHSDSETANPCRAPHSRPLGDTEPKPRTTERHGR